jgi:hypothetical protein
MQTLSHRVHILFCCQLQRRNWVLRNRNGCQPTQRQGRRSQRNGRGANCHRAIGQGRIRDVGQRIAGGIDRLTCQRLRTSQRRHRGINGNRYRG